MPDTEQQEYRIFGPPGTGKTTFLSRQIEAAAEKFGSDNVIVTSFTRAAAAELVGRDLPIPRHNIGTLHSHCFRALESPKIAELEVEDWNKTYPAYAVTPSAKGALDEGAADQTYEHPGDPLFAEMSSLRARMVNPDTWLLSIQALRKKWNEWKDANGLVDFTDLLEMSMRDIHIAPGNPSVLIADEAQDFSKLQLSLIRQWGQHTEYMLVAGDEDQLLYGWCGCTVDAFLKPPVQESHKRVLHQSFRVPRAVHAVADAWAKTLAVREPKEYEPRDFEGEVRKCRGSFQNVDPLLEDAQQYLNDVTVMPSGEIRPKTVMFLTTCSYMLDLLRKALWTAGMPYHNPYRKNRGDWNPLKNAGDGKSTAARMLAFLRPRVEVWGEHAGEWSAEELARWVEMIKGEGLLEKGAKGTVAAMSPDTIVDIEILSRIFKPNGIENLVGVLSDGTVQECVSWLQDHTLATRRKATEYPGAVLVKHGARALFERPQVIVGTIHSVKGGEADVVYLMPDLSRAGMVEWTAGGERRDGIIRQMYVGMTRARESLIICSPALNAQGRPSYFVPIPIKGAK